MASERVEQTPATEADADVGGASAGPISAERPVRRGSRSKRRLTWSRRLLYRIAVPIGMLILHFFWATCRIVRVEGNEAHLLKGPTVICYWHRHQLLCWSFLVQLFKRGLRVGWLISASVDGEAISEIARRMGGGIVFRGSTTAKGAEAVRSIHRAITRDRLSAGITPDGPYGPRSVFKPGVIKIAQLTGVPLVPISYYASHAWVLKTWDRFVVPWPGCRVAIAVGEPVAVPRRLDDAGATQIKERMERSLEELFQQARAALRNA